VIEGLRNSTPTSDVHNDVNVDELRREYDSLKSEQEDLLLMLSDQESTISDYKRRLALLGHPVEED
jgi:hypothetical protein